MTENLVIKIRPEDYLLFNLRPARKSFTNGDITIVGEGLQNFQGPVLGTQDFEQRGVFIKYCASPVVSRSLSFPFSINRI
jgi:hypothetical protein